MLVSIKWNWNIDEFRESLGRGEYGLRWLVVNRGLGLSVGGDFGFFLSIVLVVMLL